MLSFNQLYTLLRIAKVKQPQQISKCSFLSITTIFNGTLNKNTTNSSNNHSNSTIDNPLNGTHLSKLSFSTTVNTIKRVKIQVNNFDYLHMEPNDVLHCTALNIVEQMGRILRWQDHYIRVLSKCKVYVLKSCKSTDKPDPSTADTIDNNNWLDITSHTLMDVVPQITPTDRGEIFIKIVPHSLKFSK